MERICSGCHAVLAHDSQTKRCPACGGEVVARPALTESSGPPAEVDHRGIKLPRRHALGGIITPQ